MTLEQRITEGIATYFQSIVYEKNSKTITIEVMSGPESKDLRYVLKFLKVMDYQESWHDKDENSIEALIGLDELENGKQYVIFTDQRELTFTTSEKPVIKTVNKSQGSLQT